MIFLSTKHHISQQFKSRYFGTEKYTSVYLKQRQNKNQKILVMDVPQIHQRCSLHGLYSFPNVWQYQRFSKCLNEHVCNDNITRREGKNIIKGQDVLTVYSINERVLSTQYHLLLLIVIFLEGSYEIVFKLAPLLDLEFLFTISCDIRILS